MEILALSPGDCHLLSTRFADHGNSQRRMCEALSRDERSKDLERLEALRTMEIRFKIDLGSLCHRFQRRTRPKTHPLERMVLDFVAAWRTGPNGERRLWVRLDNVRQVRQLMEEDELVREPES